MIIQSLQTSGRMRIEQLAELAGVAHVTIRRDLVHLESKGVLRRIPGGATRTVKDGGNIPFSLRMSEDLDRKSKLAAAVSELINDYESVIIDNGTTCYAVARELSGRPITALCLSLHAAVALGSQPGANVLVPGGPVEQDDLALMNSQAVDSVRGIRADVAVLGACSVSAGLGLTSARFEDARVKRAAISVSERKILVTVADKLARRSNFTFGGPADLTHLVTTKDAPPEVLDPFRANQVTIIKV